MNQRQYQQWATRVIEEDIIEMALSESVETALFMHEEYGLWIPKTTQLPFPNSVVYGWQIIKTPEIETAEAS